MVFDKKKLTSRSFYTQVQLRPADRSYCNERGAYKEVQAMTIQCCKCKRIREGHDWVAVDVLPEGEVSHGFCPPCADVMFEQIQNERHINVRATRERHAWAQRPAAGLTY